MDGILSAPRPARKKAKNHHLALPVTSSNSDISTVPTFTDLLRDLSTNVANAQDYPLDPVLSSLDPSQSRAGYAASSTENTKPGLAAPQNLSSSQLITQLRLHPHPEGTYQTTGDAFNVLAGSPDSSTSQDPPSTRYCLLTPTRPHSYLHRHQADSLHFLHQGRARFVCFGPKDQLGMAREVRSHVLGPNVGESRQVRVPGGWWRYVELLDEDLAGQPNAVQQGMLMSQVCFSGPQSVFLLVPFLR
jgi:predicted cupin superfamily sugar epimerase